MRVDLGSDIPRWTFLSTVAVTGVWSMSRLMELAKKLSPNEKDQDAMNYNFM